jgi:cytochrome c oxidase assembly factor 1
LATEEKELLGQSSVTYNGAGSEGWFVLFGNFVLLGSRWCKTFYHLGYHSLHDGCPLVTRLFPAPVSPLATDLTMALHTAQRRIGVPRAFLFRRRNMPPHRSLIPAPKANSGPLMERRADRELPSINTEKRRWIKTLPIFVVVVGAAMLGIFNYQKSSSSVVSSTLYALRTSPRAREILGDEIYFAQKIPWISGEMNQLHGRIDISFWVKGTKGQGKMRFRSIRPDRMSFVRDFA